MYLKTEYNRKGPGDAQINNAFANIRQFFTLQNSSGASEHAHRVF